jgi:hypothetical protein
MSRIRLRAVLVAALAVFGSVATADGQKVWEEKPYTEWSMGDVVRVLDDSPWAQTQVGQGTDTLIVTIRLRSGLTIRQALIRQRQLQLNYERLTPANKARFDADAKDFLDCSDCAKYYIVTLSSPFNVPSPLRAIKELSLEELRPYVSLVNDKGERRELVGFIPPKGEGREAVFVFQRLDDRGRPLLSTANKRFSFKIAEKVFEGKTLLPIKKFTFEVPQLIRAGQVEF